MIICQCVINDNKLQLVRMVFGGESYYYIVQELSPIMVCTDELEAFLEFEKVVSSMITNALVDHIINTPHIEGDE